MPTVEIVGATTPTTFHQVALRAVQDAIDDAQQGYVAHDTMPLVLGDPASTRVILRFGVNPGPADGVARFSRIEEPVRVRTTVRLQYPEVARERGVTGDVKLAFVIGTNGRADTSTARVVSANFLEFVDAAKEALARTRYTPEMRDCQSLSTVVLQEFRFLLIR